MVEADTQNKNQALWRMKKEQGERTDVGFATVNLVVVDVFKQLNEPFFFPLRNHQFYFIFVFLHLLFTPIIE